VAVVVDLDRRVDADDDRQFVLRTDTDRNLPFRPPRVLSAARVRENWFSRSPSMAGSYQRAVRRDNSFLAILGRLWGACQPGAERGVPSGRGWQRRQLFVGGDDESVPIAAMCISNEGRLPTGING